MVGVGWVRSDRPQTDRPHHYHHRPGALAILDVYTQAEWSEVKVPPNRSSRPRGFIYRRGVLGGFETPPGHRPPAISAGTP